MYTSGNFGTVNVAVDVLGKVQVACKTIKLRSKEDREHVRKEISILRKLDHVGLFPDWLNNIEVSIQSSRTSTKSWMHANLTVELLCMDASKD